VLLLDILAPNFERRDEGADGDDVRVGDDAAELDDPPHVLVVDGVDGGTVGRADVRAEALADQVAVQLDGRQAWDRFDKKVPPNL
jgi:hypothetical protein